VRDWTFAAQAGIGLMRAGEGFFRQWIEVVGQASICAILWPSRKNFTRCTITRPT
jgi:hypothetical protein